MLLIILAGIFFDREGNEVGNNSNQQLLYAHV